MQFEGSSIEIDFEGAVANKTEFKLDLFLNRLLKMSSY